MNAATFVDKITPNTIADISTTLELQRKDHIRAGAPDLATRRERLGRLIALLVDHQNDFVDAMHRDFGHRDRITSLTTDLMSTVQGLKHAYKQLPRWMKPSRRPTLFPLNLLGARSRVEYSPLGVVGIMSPWNFPVNLSFAPLCSVLAAGNRAVIKPSEHTPETSALMQRLIAEYFKPAEVQVITGGAEVARAFTSQSWDHLIYTGGGETAKHVMRAAAEHLVPVTLELGGKSPTIVGRSAKLGLAVRRIMLGKVLNTGQICLAPDYVFVPREQLDAFIAEARTTFAEMYPDRTINENFSTIVNDAHHNRLKGYVDDAKSLGLRMVDLGEDRNYVSDASRAMSPVLILDPPENAKVMREEIFGPLLPVKTYESFDEVLDYINARPHPLALYYFGSDKAEQRRILTHTHSGAVTFNDVIMHSGMEELPFGGVGASGTGAYHGHAGFLNFSHQRAVFSQTGIDVGKAGRPPYGKMVEMAIKQTMKK